MSPEVGNTTKTTKPKRPLVVVVVVVAVVVVAVAVVVVRRHREVSLSTKRKSTESVGFKNGGQKKTRIMVIQS